MLVNALPVLNADITDALLMIREGGYSDDDVLRSFGARCLSAAADIADAHFDCLDAVELRRLAVLADTDEETP